MSIPSIPAGQGPAVVSLAEQRRREMLHANRMPAPTARCRAIPFDDGSRLVPVREHGFWDARPKTVRAYTPRPATPPRRRDS